MFRLRGSVVAAMIALMGSVTMAPSFCFANSPALSVISTESLSSQGGITIVSPTGIPIVLTTADVAKLPTVQVDVSFFMGAGIVRESFKGPLLWTVLERALSIHAEYSGVQARQIAIITGRGGYVAVLALGEISPAYEGKPVILAESMNGRLLGMGCFRVVVPGDQREDRSVNDVEKIAIVAPTTRARGGI
jgi:hypothetical protein